MGLLKQISVTVLAIVPLPLWLAASGAAGHVTLFFTLILQPIVAGVVFIVYFQSLATRSGSPKAKAFGRAIVASVIIIAASFFEWTYIDWLVSVKGLLFGTGFNYALSKASNTFFVTMMFIYFSLSIALSVAITYWLFHSYQGESLADSESGD